MNSLMQFSWYRSLCCPLEPQIPAMCLSRFYSIHKDLLLVFPMHSDHLPVSLILVTIWGKDRDNPAIPISCKALRVSRTPSGPTFSNLVMFRYAKPQLPLQLFTGNNAPMIQRWYHKTLILSAIHKMNLNCIPLFYTHNQLPLVFTWQQLMWYPQYRSLSNYSI